MNDLPNHYIDTISGRDWAKERMERLYADNLALIKRLEDKEQQLAAQKEIGTSYYNELERIKQQLAESQQRIATLEKSMYDVWEERDRLQAQLTQAVELLERNGVVRKDLFSRTEKKEET